MTLTNNDIQTIPENKKCVEQYMADRESKFWMNVTLTSQRSVKAGCCWWWGPGCRWTARGQSAPLNPLSASQAALREPHLKACGRSPCNVLCWWRSRGQGQGVRGMSKHTGYIVFFSMHNGSHCPSPYSCISPTLALQLISAAWAGKGTEWGKSIEKQGEIHERTTIDL